MKKTRKKLEISKPFIGEEEISAVVNVLKSRNLSQGHLVQKLEKDFASYCGTKYAVAVNSGTATLHCILHALGVNENDEVITTPFTFVATANSILMQKAKVVFCDIDADTFNIDPKKIEEKITKKTKVIMPVDLYGRIYDVKSINGLAKKHNIKVVEDAAQSVGAKYLQKRAGSIADASSFSFYATKNLTAGVGGILTTNSKQIAEKCKSFRHHGQNENKLYEYKDFGYNYRMIDMIAAIALEQLKKIEKFTQVRRRNAKLLTEGLQGIKGIILPIEKPGYKDVFHQYTIRITKECKANRNKLIKFLENKGIMTRIYYPKPLHLYPHFIAMGYKKGDFPVAEKIASEVLSIPVHPLVTENDIQYIINSIKQPL
ncbi:DegT/DnrJ/EryC1/StrS family aminotransferase [Candidatus Microgenomates bacterium]|nr:MAG: DegT/DnrJ/EryC1/StrS family aminotransferase [Candidatus Microgenomates bacterium]